MSSVIGWYSFPEFLPRYKQFIQSFFQETRKYEFLLLSVTLKFLSHLNNDATSMNLKKALLRYKIITWFKIYQKDCTRFCQLDCLWWDSLVRWKLLTLTSSSVKNFPSSRKTCCSSALSISPFPSLSNKENTLLMAAWLKCKCKNIVGDGYNVSYILKVHFNLKWVLLETVR